MREESGLSQATFAERIGLSLKSGKGYISHLEKGRIKNPRIGTILLFLRVCGASWVVRLRRTCPTFYIYSEVRGEIKT
uniref:XRE family transcriptional regulator n=1 Tax=candidate division WOR-3 bacterium TaxID=2052148 RepID=A0A7C6EA16_UNCW3